MYKCYLIAFRSDKIFIFQIPIDLLKALLLHRENFRNWNVVCVTNSITRILCVNRLHIKTISDSHVQNRDRPKKFYWSYDFRTALHQHSEFIENHKIINIRYRCRSVHNKVVSHQRDRCWIIYKSCSHIF